MKKALFILATSSLFMLSSCNKEKDCMCTHETYVEGIEEPGISTGRVKIAKGECSDLNEVQTNEVSGTEATTHSTCVEQ